MEKRNEESGIRAQEPADGKAIENRGLRTENSHPGAGKSQETGRSPQSGGVVAGVSRAVDPFAAVSGPSNRGGAGPGPGRMAYTARAPSNGVGASPGPGAGAGETGSTVTSARLPAGAGVAGPDAPAASAADAQGEATRHAGTIAVGPGAADAEPGPNNTLTAAPNGVRLLERIVALVREKGGTDIHLLEGDRPRVRVRGDLLPLEAKDHPLVTRRDILDILEVSLSVEQKHRFEQKADIDFSLEFKNATGRVNVGLANGRKLHFTMRYLPAALIPLDRLGMDVEMLRKILLSGSGLIVVAGEPSSGKTTTIMAMLDAINHARYGAITTIENPIEYVLHSDRCVIARREVGRDTPDFHEALRASVRKNPDCLLIGEIRDVETASIALTAAETGIETFCTVHAGGAIAAISRLNNIMTSGGQKEEQFLVRLSNVLRVILWQQLVKTVEEKGVVPVYEILNVTYAEKQYLRERDFARLEQSLEADHNISLGKSVYRLWNQSPRVIGEKVVKQVFGDQYNLMMTRLVDKTGYKPLLATVSEERFVG